VASKYDGLGDYLRQQPGPSYTMSFDQIERLIGTPQPASSRIWSAWWGNGLAPQAARSVEARLARRRMGVRVDRPGSADRQLSEVGDRIDSQRLCERPP